MKLSSMFLKNSKREGSCLLDTYCASATVLNIGFYYHLFIIFYNMVVMHIINMPRQNLILSTPLGLTCMYNYHIVLNNKYSTLVTLMPFSKSLTSCNLWRFHKLFLADIGVIHIKLSPSQTFLKYLVHWNYVICVYIG
jgi:hypothetical protein